MSDGFVALVGAGPGHPGLLTLRGAELLAQADVVVYDRLAALELLDLAPVEAERIFVGKEPGRQAMSQEDINETLVQGGRNGRRVVRLKGGDPFVFGRGGEEALALAEAGIRFEVVPGVTSAIAAPAAAGIPVTHRNLATSLAIVTGHEDPTKPADGVDWSRMALGADTLVVVMGVERLDQIVSELREHGRPGSQPAALIEWGTTARQRVAAGTLDNIAQVATRDGIAAPAVLVVGEVVALRQRIATRVDGSLAGLKVLVTRSRDQASRLSRLLAERGALPIEFPAIEIEPLADTALLDAALAHLTEYDWVVFTSVNGVSAVFGRLEAVGRDARAFGGARLCAIGPATAGALRQRGLRADWMPEEFLTSAILAGFQERGVAGNRFLLLRADIADPSLAAGLQAAGAVVADVTAYCTVPARTDAGRMRAALECGGVDVVTFASSSTVRNLAAALDGRIDLLTAASIVCIGPVTAAAAAELGLRVDAVATQHTIEGLVDAVEDVAGRPQLAEMSFGR